MALDDDDMVTSGPGGEGPADGGAPARRAPTTAAPTAALTVAPTRGAGGPLDSGAADGVAGMHDGGGATAGPTVVPTAAPRARSTPVRPTGSPACTTAGPTAAPRVRPTRARAARRACTTAVRTVARTVAPTAARTAGAPTEHGRDRAGAGRVRARTARRCAAASASTRPSSPRGYWATRPLLTRRRPAGVDFGDLLSLAAVDELTVARGLRTPFLRVAKDGKVVEPAPVHPRRRRRRRDRRPGRRRPAGSSCSPTARRWCCRGCTGPGRRWSTSAAGSRPSSATRCRSTRT